MFFSVSYLLCVIKYQYDPDDDENTRLVQNNFIVTSITDITFAIMHFVWNYLDVFIMMISIGLSSHFELLNTELERRKREVNL